MTTEQIDQRCDHEGCMEEPDVDCFLPDTSTDGDPDFRYCVSHCHQNGFCYACGGFFAGIESFDFRPSGLCDNCHFDSDDYDDYDDYEDYQ